MGHYIQCERNVGKAQQIVLEHGAIAVANAPVNLDGIPDDMALICVVENGDFDAAALIHDQRELEDFSIYDTSGRYRTWLVMNKELAWRLSGYKG